MFSTRGCTASGVLTFVTICVCLFCYIEGQTDGHLSCPDKWTRGDNIQLLCVMEINRLNNRCNVSVDDAFFSLDGTRQCTINSTDFQQCSSPSSASTPGCRCETNGTHFIFKYTFKALETHTGSWTCQKLCQEYGGFPITLNVTSDSACTTVVQEKPNFKDQFHRYKIVAIVFIVSFLVSVGVIVGLSIYICWLKKKHRNPAPDYPGSNDIRSGLSTTYTGKANGS